MRISQECDYAFRIILYFATKPPGPAVEARTVVEAQHIPLRFALKIFRKLCEAGILRSFRGVHGGYTMIAEPQDITFRQVIETIDGPLYLNKCMRPDGECSREAKETCPVRKHLTAIQGNISSILDDVKVSDVICKNA